MPKRVPTPPPSDDEPRFYTVFQPYPLNVNWLIADDYIKFSQWIAFCLGGDSPFINLHWKPKARAMVLIEVQRDFPPDRVLGEHRWSEFLLNPSDEEQGRVTQIFHSLYSNGRDAQKDGWKKIEVKSGWFTGMSFDNNEIFRHPYPERHWCPVPPEDRTNKNICRPLPKATSNLVAPPKPAPPVVGSAAWVGDKSAQPGKTTQAARGAWGRGRGRGTTSINTNTRATQPEKKSATAASASPLSANAWNKPIVVHTPTPRTPVQSSTVPMRPPGLPHPAGITGAAYPPPPGLIHDSTSTTSTSSFGLLSPPLEEQFVRISISPSQEAALSGLTLDSSPDLAAGYVASWQQVKPEETLWADTYADNGGEVIENLWADADDDEKKENPEDICPVHPGQTCKKGICKARAEMEKKKEREKAAAERKKKGGDSDQTGAKKKNGNWRGGRGKGPSSNNVDDDGFATVPSKGRGRKAGTDSSGSTDRSGASTPFNVQNTASVAVDDEDNDETNPWG